jgi:AbrB family looped-hinge helix DNA binding protein
MMTTRLSSKGQIIIPKSIRSRHHWEPGQELQAIEAGDGILLKPKSPFPETALKKVASSLPFSGRARTLAEMEAAIKKGARSRKHGRH